MTLALATAPSMIRDADLISQLEKAPPFMRDTVRRQCEDEQQRRDSISALSRDARRRALTKRKLEQSRGIERDDLRHIHSVVAIAALPYTAQPLTVREWERTQGKMSLKVIAGQLMSPENGQWVDQPIPSGSRARLMLLHTCSEAIRQKSPTIEIADSLSGFIKDMGFPVTGGKNGTLQSFKQQINALAACSMKIGVWDGHRSKTLNAQPFSSLEVWLQSQPNDRLMWPSSITFSQEFYQTLKQHALPVNVHAVRAFAGSPRKLDMLFWLGYRLNGLTKPTPISWSALKDQFGIGYSRERRFRSDFAQEIAEIMEVFPKLPVKLNEEGIVISPGAHEVLAIPTKVRR